MEILKILLLTLSIIHQTLSNGNKGISVYNYHENVGIPWAAKIKEIEDKIKYSKSQKIVGGSITDVADIPYQVGLIARISDRYSLCGGSLISSNSVVTAAHCCYDGNVTTDYFIAVLGSNTIFSGGVRIFTNDITMHPDFDVETIANDIAVVKIATVSFSDKIQPVALPIKEKKYENFVGQIGIASGYGLSADDAFISFHQTLYSVKVKIISNDECSAFYRSHVTDKTICTSGKNGKGTCGGDSGGPLVVLGENRHILIGVTSFGTPICEWETPSAYTRVTSFVQWIESVTEEK